MALVPGTRIGVYDITAPIGEGGMGQVYRATDTTLGRQVAIKILPDAFAADPERLARFEREAKTLASLNHPHIAAVYGFEKSASVRALVMELVEGDDLSQRIARGAIPLDEALPIAKQIAEALEAAHEQGIIHRDLKPANIKVRSDGTVKVLDFGLAKAMEPAAGSSSNMSLSPTLSMHATQAGIILGTAAYMSPEQAAGKPVDKRSDLWAFGVVLLEMLTGRQTFGGETTSHVLASVLKDEPDWTTLPATTPLPIRRLLRRCLEKDPKRRMADASDAKLEIEEPWVNDEASPGRANGSRRRHLTGLALASLAVAMIAAFAVTLSRVRISSSTPTVARFAFPVPRGIAATNRQVVAISPDGRQIAYSAAGRVFLRDVWQFNPHEIAGSDLGQIAANPTFSPDGQSLVFSSSSGVDVSLRKLAVGGGAAVKLCDISSVPYGISWGADGILVGQGPYGIIQVSPSGGASQPVITVKDGELAQGPQRLAGTDWVLFTLGRGTPGAQAWDSAQIVAESLRTHQRRVLVQGGSDGRWLTSGHLVYALGGILFGAPFDAASATVTGAPVPVLEGVSRALLAGTAQFSVSSTGTLAYLPGSANSAATTEDLGIIDNQEVKRLGFPPASYAVPRLSPDGTRIAVQREVGTEAAIWIYDLSTTSPPRRLTFTGSNRFPTWSADGQRVAFQSNRDGDAAVFWQRADGNGAAERLTKPEPNTAHVPESFSPNGDWLLFRAEKGAGVSLHLWSARGRGTEPFDHVQSSRPTEAVFSPNGRWVAYTSSGRGGALAVFVQPFPPTGAIYQVPLAGGDGTARHPIWSPDGNELLYSAGAGARAVVRIRTNPAVTFGTPSIWQLPPTAVGDPQQRNWDGMHDGRRLVAVIDPALAEPGANSDQLNIVLNWMEELKQRVPVK